MFNWIKNLFTSSPAVVAVTPTPVEAPVVEAAPVVDSQVNWPFPTLRPAETIAKKSRKPRAPKVDQSAKTTPTKETTTTKTASKKPTAIKAASAKPTRKSKAK
tara:strand:- start:355 stop:663 length:309 start_codon:yes stop_codon:yes gene_type:complete